MKAWSVCAGDATSCRSSVCPAAATSLMPLSLHWDLTVLGSSKKHTSPNFKSYWKYSHYVDTMCCCFTWFPPFLFCVPRILEAARCSHVTDAGFTVLARVSFILLSVACKLIVRPTILFSLLFFFRLIWCSCQKTVFLFVLTELPWTWKNGLRRMYFGKRICDLVAVYLIWVWNCLWLLSDWKEVRLWEEGRRNKSVDKSAFPVKTVSDPVVQHLNQKAEKMRTLDLEYCYTTHYPTLRTKPLSCPKSCEANSLIKCPLFRWQTTPWFSCQSTAHSCKRWWAFSPVRLSLCCSFEPLQQVSLLCSVSVPLRAHHRWRHQGTEQ